MAQVTMNDRLRLAALVDRMVYGDKDVFSRRDAAETLEIMRRVRPRRAFSLAVKGNAGTRSTQGAAAGFGVVRFDEERKIDFDSEAENGVRAGQWKAHYYTPRLPLGREIVEIEQMMGGPEDEGRGARIEFRHGAPLRMTIKRLRKASFPALWIPGRGWLWISLGMPYFAAWKTPSDQRHEEAGPYDPHGPGERSGMGRMAA
jgi:hypothetical protein